MKKQTVGESVFFLILNSKDVTSDKTSVRFGVYSDGKLIEEITSIFVGPNSAMKMKFNWGTGIFIVITMFILAVVAFLIYTSNLDIKLVEDNYYDKELAYQDRIDKLNNTASLPWKINVEQEPGIIIIQFPILKPPVAPEGTLLLYRPSDPGEGLFRSFATQ